MTVERPRREMTMKEAEKRIAKVSGGQCQVEGCEAPAVAYHASADWKLCQRHSVLLSKRSRVKWGFTV